MDIQKILLDNLSAIGVIGAVVGITTFWWFYLPPMRLVWRCLSHEERFPLWPTLMACKASAFPFKPAIFRKQMRLWLELRILQPKPSREASWAFNPKTKRYQLQIDEQAYRDKLSEWTNDIRGKFGALKIKEQEPVIQVNDVFRLNDDTTKNGIKQYLLAVAELKLCLDEAASFLCKVKINEGFLLPLNLLAGLMARFEDDWDPIISSYAKMAGKGFSPLQASIFDLWLLWGPSVPICTCAQWSGPITLQYGFGDENNSVRVYVQDTAKDALLGDLRKSMEKYKINAYPALHASIVGTLWPPSSFLQGQFCAAQVQQQNPDRESFILKYDSHTLNGSAAGGHLLYTAYVWALFVIGRGTKPKLDEIKNEPWLSVVPFFEHANIVNEETYAAAKLQLAHKALSFVKNSKHFEADPAQTPISLWYVCAIDDSGCGHNIEIAPNSASIRSVIEGLLEETEYRGLRKQIITDDKSFAGILSGCHLSEMVVEFFNAVSKTPRA